MPVRWSVAFVLLCALPAQGQTAAAVLTNSGDPLRVGFDCAEEELQRAGLDCSEEHPCPIYLELSAIARGGGKIFVAGNLHSSSGTLASIILMSGDAGASWKEPAARIRGAALDQLQFFDPEHGWAAGETQDPLPRDPFFLMTTSGGDSWRRRAVSEDGAPGSVQGFWFDSAQHGALLIDAGRSAAGGRYRAYESETGGESWMIRGATAQPPKIPGAPGGPESSDLRLRATQDGKAWQIEQRGSGLWSSLASFLVEPASCAGKP